MINDDYAIKALCNMKFDIENTMVKPDSDRWYYYISIYSRNKIGLMYSSYLLKLLGITTNFIGMIPNTYKHCAFDCISIANIFREIYSSDNTNTEGISILECDTIDNDDFYVLITKESRDNKDHNIIMAYKTFMEYCK